MLKTLVLSTLIAFQIYSQDTLFFNHTAIPGEDTVLVFLPSEYDAETTYPMLILLHGYEGNYNQWNETSGGLQQYADRYGFIIACPDGFYGSWYANSTVNDKIHYRDFFFGQLYPSLLKTLSVDEKHIFISGLSMGGYGAVSIFLERPDLFRAAGSTSGVLDIVPFIGRFGLDKVFGSSKSNTAAYKQNSPYYLLRETAFDKPLYIDCGANDLFYDVNRLFYERCRELNLPVTFLAQPGTHSHKYWKESIKEHLRFFNAIVTSK